ncbi:glycosyltransferase family 10 (fucosyltransferase) c-term domain-containing protein [Phthorimaea operculella]|nr:glycosyltransferase family 10 (fucosyltransferase) c-term domain-containing protein [Phthorimaea operculella]
MKLYDHSYFLPFTISMLLAEINSVQETLKLEHNSSVFTEPNPKVNEVDTELEMARERLNILKSLEKNATSNTVTEKLNVYEATPKNSSILNFILLTEITKQEETTKTTVRAESASEQDAAREIEENESTQTKSSSTHSTTTKTTLNHQKDAIAELSLETLLKTIPHIVEKDPYVQYIDFFSNFSEKSLKEFGDQGDVVKDVNNTKYILQWSGGCHEPFRINMHAGQQIFTSRNCSFTNCVITKNKDLLDSYTKFDAIVFFAKDILKYQRYFGKLDLRPQDRSPLQRYVFASYDYTQPFPPSSIVFNGFFNWTWTYRLDSDLTLPHFVVKDIKGNIVAPRNDVKWIKQEDMLPVSDEVRRILAEKKADKVVAWFDTSSNLEPKIYPIMAKLCERLRLEYDIHIFRFAMYSGNDCNTDETRNACDQMLRSDFHFYLAFEEQLSEDFVSDNVLRAYNNFVIPIVLGGANYTRFLPEGSYINTIDYDDMCSLAQVIYELLNDFERYVEYFKWTNHYTFRRVTEDPHTDHLCRICEMLNDENQPTKIHHDFTSWWGISIPIKKSTPVITLMKDEKPNPIITFLDQAAQAVSEAVKILVKDVKSLWKKMTYW